MLYLKLLLAHGQEDSAKGHDLCLPLLWQHFHFDGTHHFTQVGVGDAVLWFLNCLGYVTVVDK